VVGLVEAVVVSGAFCFVHLGVTYEGLVVQYLVIMGQHQTELYKKLVNYQ
jgi:hypothetical protein